MDKLSNQIYMNYQAMWQRAARLEELAGELESLARNEVASYASNSSSWKGDSADVCRQKLRKLESNLNSRAKTLQKTADALRKTAERQYNLEKALVALVSH